MYQWWVFVHIVGVFGFLIAHGVSVAVAFQLRGERDPKRVSGLLQLSGSSIRAFYASLALLLVGGVVAGFLGRWWSQAWIWASLGLLVATSIAMFVLARPYYRRVAVIANARAGGSTAVTDEQFDEMLRSRRPYVVAAIGFGALVMILYLMMFKPTLGLSGPEAPAASGGPGQTCAPAGVTVRVSATNSTFDADCLAALSSRPFSIVFNNQDPGVPHNVSIYTDPSASQALFVGQIFPGPKAERYAVSAIDRGSYYFRCDVHPDMNGRFLIE